MSSYRRFFINNDHERVNFMVTIDDDRTDLKVTFHNKDILTLETQRNSHFYGFLPQDLVVVSYGEYIGTTDHGPEYMSNQSEYFLLDQWVKAAEVFVTRARSDKPWQETGLSRPLEELLFKDPVIERQRNQTKWQRLAQEKGFCLPKVQHEDPIPPHSNPYHYDAFNMGSGLVRGWEIMHEGYDRPEQPTPLHYVILINKRTGQRIRVELVPPRHYVYRSLGSDASPDYWCVFGTDTGDKTGGVGVLEWCADEKDAIAMFTTMREYPQFTKLVVMRFSDPKSVVREYEHYE